MTPAFSTSTGMSWRKLHTPAYRSLWPQQRSLSCTQREIDWTRWAPLLHGATLRIRQLYLSVAAGQCFMSRRMEHSDENSPGLRQVICDRSSPVPHRPESVRSPNRSVALSIGPESPSAVCPGRGPALKHVAAVCRTNSKQCRWQSRLTSPSGEVDLGMNWA
jgi:hypothetical protein